MAYLETTECCGIRELDEIQGSTAAQNLDGAAYHWFDGDQRSTAFVFFSAVSTSNAGHELAVLIKKEKLGTILKTKATKNPNSGNMLTMWVWTVNKTNFKKWWDKNRARIQINENW